MSTLRLLILHSASLVAASQAFLFCPIRFSATTSPGSEPEDGDGHTLPFIAGSARNGSRTFYIRCPASDERPEDSHCCRERDGCCPDAEPWSPLSRPSEAPGIYGHVLAALLVSGICFLLAIGLLICSFCPRCPFYDSCRIRYTRDEAGCADKMGEINVFSDQMPMEESPLGNVMALARPLPEQPTRDRWNSPLEVPV